ncbi:hypothetical protein NDU88_004818 [Pleurodeles waltl]|uniref:Uncharacterized protein n=1 Tax=Pleurodeles waltl TaxID=8319 RepID=A0AAV7V4M6_PLEWA|nr:hypothetical protein NDU88_004818 [Pleurodeles waltl]
MSPFVLLTSGQEGSSHLGEFSVPRVMFAVCADDERLEEQLSPWRVPAYTGVMSPFVLDDEWPGGQHSPWRVPVYPGVMYLFVLVMSGQKGSTHLGELQCTLELCPRLSW